jgi:hypothetical protein
VTHTDQTDHQVHQSHTARQATGDRRPSNPQPSGPTPSAAFLWRSWRPGRFQVPSLLRTGAGGRLINDQSEKPQHDVSPFRNSRSRLATTAPLLHSALHRTTRWQESQLPPRPAESVVGTAQHSVASVKTEAFDPLFHDLKALGPVGFGFTCISMQAGSPNQPRIDDPRDAKSVIYRHHYWGKFRIRASIHNSCASYCHLLDLNKAGCQTTRRANGAIYDDKAIVCLLADFGRGQRHGKMEW